MQKLVITGGIPLEGTVTLQGAKIVCCPFLQLRCSAVEKLCWKIVPV